MNLCHVNLFFLRHVNLFNKHVMLKLKDFDTIINNLGLK